MKRLILISYFLFTCFFCFAQQNMPAKIIWNTKAVDGSKKYQIQVGAYKTEKNMQEAIDQLKSIDLMPATEKFRDFTRVLVKEIPLAQIKVYLASIAKAGFSEVIVREDTPSKKQDNNATPSELLCRTWKIESCPNPELNGSRLFILDNGTYYVTNAKGESSSLSDWRWNGDASNDFEYTHNDWDYYGRAEIIRLTDNTFELLDSGYSYDVPGRSSAGYSNHWVFTAVP